MEIQLSFELLEEVQAFLHKHWPPTRLVEARCLSRRVNSNVYVKMETDLPTSTFKPRGALYALARRLKGGAVDEVVASSTGNHGAAVAYAGWMLKVPVTIFLPEKANSIKRARIAALGAKIVNKGKDSAEAYLHAKVYAESKTDKIAYLLDDATDPSVPVATATIACEIMDQLPSTQAIYVPMGDTALIRGIANAIRFIGAQVEVIGVQAANAPAYYLSWKNRKAINTDRCDTIADGLA